MKRLPLVIVVLLALAALCWWFPPFHVRSLEAVRQTQANREFDPADFASSFWTERLLPAIENATDAAAVLDRAAVAPEAVGEEFGRTVGLGGSYFLFLRGRGRVVHADEDSVGLSLLPGGNEPQIVIELGFVFGNAVRDATGLISASSFPNAQQFNDISAALNGRVETNVLPRVQQLAEIGATLRFAGCAEISDPDLDLKPLTLVPVRIQPD